MRFYAGVTDGEWYNFLSALQPDEVNFWKPGLEGTFQALQPGEPFLFKLKRPYNHIAGGGFFVSFSRLPISLSWAAFGTKNGADGLFALRRLIAKNRKVPLEELEPDPSIGCIILSNPFFFPPPLWIPVSDIWPGSAVQGKTYDLASGQGAALWQQVMARLEDTKNQNPRAVSELPLVAESTGRYGSPYLTRARLGQGAFRVLVTDAYSRRCSMTGERTLPVLDAAHIKPYEELGPHAINNGLLLRADLHKLFDQGLVTVTPQLQIEVSRKIKEEYENGKEYYKLHGQPLAVVPSPQNTPGKDFLTWHNENRYRE